MRILLLSMPDSFEHTPVLAIRMPNGALASLAGNVDSRHQVSVADLVDKGAVRDGFPVKVLGTGEISVKVEVAVHKFSASAKEKIEAAGGTVTVL